MLCSVEYYINFFYFIESFVHIFKLQVFLSNVGLLDQFSMVTRQVLAPPYLISKLP